VNYDAKVTGRPRGWRGHSSSWPRPSYGEGNVKAGPRAIYRCSPGGAVGSGSRNSAAGRGRSCGSSAHIDFPARGLVELFNTKHTGVDISGCWLSDDSGDETSYRARTARLLRGAVFREGGGPWTRAQLGFSSVSGRRGDSLVNSNRTRVLDAVRFRRPGQRVSPRDVSPDGARILPPWPPTLGTNNEPCFSRLVIKRILYTRMVRAGRR
jgi:hypothetical protein